MKVHTNLIKFTLGVGVALFIGCGGNNTNKNNTNPPANNPPQNNNLGQTKPETITHNGIVYDTVISPFTDRVWLDRNLGAARKCISAQDSACFGNYYQWNRGDDGHQDPNSGTTETEFIDPDNTSSEFVINHMFWTGAVLDESNWAKIDGSSICPTGFRVPTVFEIRAETLDAPNPVTNADEAFNSFLALPKSGYRDTDGQMHNDYNGFWLNELVTNNPGSYFLKTTKNDVMIDTDLQSAGYPVRCIKY